MPETSYLKGSCNENEKTQKKQISFVTRRRRVSLAEDEEIQERQKAFKDGFKDINIKDVPLILEKQTRMIEHLSNLRLL